MLTSKSLKIINDLSERFYSNKEKIDTKMENNEDWKNEKDERNKIFKEIANLDKETLISLFNLTEEKTAVFGEFFARDLIYNYSSDKEVIAAALKCDPLALYGASKEIRNDAEFMKWAQEYTHGYAYQYCGSELGDNEELATHALMVYLYDDNCDDIVCNFSKLHMRAYDRVIKRFINNPDEYKNAEKSLNFKIRNCKHDKKTQEALKKKLNKLEEIKNFYNKLEYGSEK